MAKLMAEATKHYTKEEKRIRGQVESIGAELPARVPSCLTDDQKKIYKTIYKNLKDTGILKVLDTEVMINASVIIDRLHKIDERIDREPSLYLTDKDMSMLRARYFQQFLGICKELCLSPAARAKLGSLVLDNHNKKKDELMNALVGD